MHASLIAGFPFWIGLLSCTDKNDIHIACLDVYSKVDMRNFFEECISMKCFKHPNVVELLGMCLDSPDGIPLMVIPFMANGNLKKYLQQSRGYSYKINTCPNVSMLQSRMNVDYKCKIQ